MSLTVKVPNEIEESANELARVSGRTPEQIILDALRAHFPPVPEGLAQEMRAWDAAGDIDAEAFNKTNGVTW